jgi:SAM-dependent methyltransferase
MHFTTVPALQEARKHFLNHATASLPKFGRPIRFLDLGCGDGGLTLALLQTLCDRGYATGIDAVLLVDPSAKMLRSARQLLTGVFPKARIDVLEGRAEAVTRQAPPGFDIALSSLAWHHMPYEIKLGLATAVADRADHVLLFEIEGHHDTPERHSPALAVSVYQLYGAAVEMVMTHPAPRVVIEACLDHFLTGELISLMTETRGQRTEYHMLRRQWHALLSEGLGPDFECRADCTCWYDELTEMFMLHYGRRRITA